MAEIGLINSATYAYTLSGIDEMMDKLPDNTGNEISAQDMRNVVFTLYTDIQSSSASEFFYTNPDPVSNPVGNWTTGKTFSNVSLQDLFNGIFYKDSGPGANLEFVPTQTTLEYKQPNTPILYPYNTGFDEVSNFKLKWTATKGTYNLQSIGVITRSPSPVVPEVPQNGDPLFTVNVPPTGGSETIQVITKPRLNVSNTYTFTFTDIKGNVGTKSITISYGVKFYWGRKANKSAFTSSSDIINLDGAGVSGTGGFASSFVRSFNGINGSGQYICWAFPSSFGTPKFIVNGLSNTAFTKINSQFSFRNAYGYQTDYDVWITDTAQNSPIGKLEITT